MTVAIQRSWPLISLIEKFTIDGSHTGRTIRAAIDNLGQSRSPARGNWRFTTGIGDIRPSLLKNIRWQVRGNHCRDGGARRSRPRPHQLKLKQIVNGIYIIKGESNIQKSNRSKNLVSMGNPTNEEVMASINGLNGAKDHEDNILNPQPFELNCNLQSLEG